MTKGARELDDLRISPAFESMFRDRPQQREAVVVFQPTTPPAVRLRGRLRKLDERLREVEERAAGQLAVQRDVICEYLKENEGELAGGFRDVNLAVGSAALPVATLPVTPDTIESLANRPEVVAVMPNQPVHLIKPEAVDYEQLADDEAREGVTWGLERLEVRRLWQTTTGADISVAVLDTGVHADHPVLDKRVREFVAIDPLGRRVHADPPFDAGTHGTHVCGTIAGGVAKLDRNREAAIGVAPGASLLVAAVLMGNATLRCLVEAMSWAVERGADIVNMSLGLRYYEPLFAEVFSLLLEQNGVLPIVAIGNESHGNTSSPGSAHNALSVGAAEQAADGTLRVANFSSGASLAFPGEEPHALVHKPDLAAPGAQVFSSVPPQERSSGRHLYSYMDGTSMAAPHVAGVAALLMAAYPSTPVPDIVAALKDTASHPAGAERRPDNRWGYGFVRPVEALAALA